MTLRLLERPRLLLPLLAFLALHALPLPASAEEAQGAALDREQLDREKIEVERSARKARNPMRSRTSRYLGAAAEEVDEGKPQEAKRLLLKLRPNRLNPHERAYVYRMLAYVSYGSEEYEEAIGYFRKVLEQDVLSIQDEARIRFNIAQLYAAMQSWPDVINELNQWLVWVDVPSPLGYYLMGVAYYQLDDADAAIVQTRKALELSDEPREAWLRLLAALYAQKEDYDNTVPVLEELVLRFPKKQYWVQLSLIYGALENYRLSLAVQQVAYAQGLITEDLELRRLARSYLYHDLPLPAAQVLDKGIEDGSIPADAESLELLANSWIAAREFDRSLSPLQRAAELSDDGELYVRLGQVHMQREEWTEAAELLGKAIEKGGLEDPGNAELLLGICYYNGEHTARARTSFLRARKHDSSRSEADRWITHLDTESEAQAG
jgi:tetratricopeptide (TPR) repeat protein